MNIEFEQAVFNDIINDNTKAFERGTSDQLDNYANWINGLTSQQSAYPNLTPGTAAYNNFLTQFNNFLTQYNSLSTGNSSPILTGLNPEGLIKLFKNITKNL